MFDLSVCDTTIDEWILSDKSLHCVRKSNDPSSRSPTVSWGRPRPSTPVIRSLHVPRKLSRFMFELHSALIAIRMSYLFHHINLQFVVMRMGYNDVLCGDY